MSYVAIIKKLKKSGNKITKTRKVILEIFNSAKKPISAGEVLKIFENYELYPNKTTVYREIKFLLEKEIIKQINFLDNIIRYELEKDHHHHLVCNSCKNIIKIECSEQFEKQIIKKAKVKGFSIVSSSIEFFGICNNCNK